MLQQAAEQGGLSVIKHCVQRFGSEICSIVRPDVFYACSAVGLEGGGTADGWRGQLGQLCKGVDSQLQQALQGSILLLGKPSRVNKLCLHQHTLSRMQSGFGRGVHAVLCFVALYTQFVESLQQA